MCVCLSVSVCVCMFVGECVCVGACRGLLREGDQLRCSVVRSRVSGLLSAKDVRFVSPCSTAREQGVIHVVKVRPSSSSL